MVCVMDVPCVPTWAPVGIEIEQPLQIMTLASRPYPDTSNIGLYRALVVDGTRLPLPAHCPVGLYDVLLSCWELDPQQRPQFHEIHRQLQVRCLREAVQRLAMRRMLGYTM